MPTYDYRCPAGHDTEKFYRTISAAQSEIPCPTCGEVAARRMSKGAGLVFKGSGFYLTDYGKNAHRGTAPEKADAKGESKTDSKGGGDGGSSDGAAKPETSSKSSDAKSPAPATPTKSEKSESKSSAPTPKSGSDS